MSFPPKKAASDSKPSPEMSRPIKKKGGSSNNKMRIPDDEELKEADAIEEFTLEGKDEEADEERKS